MIFRLLIVSCVLSSCMSSRGSLNNGAPYSISTSQLLMGEGQWISKIEDQLPEISHEENISYQVRVETRLINTTNLEGLDEIVSMENRCAIISPETKLDLIKIQNLESKRVPLLTCYNGQRANISILEQLAYIQGYETVYERGALLLNPKIGYTQSGMTVDLIPCWSAKDENFKIGFSFINSKLLKLVQQEIKDLYDFSAGDQFVEIPLFDNYQIEPNIYELKNEDTLVIRENLGSIVMITPTLIELSEEEIEANRHLEMADLKGPEISASENDLENITIKVGSPISKSPEIAISENTSGSAFIKVSPSIGSKEIATQQQNK